MHAETTDSRPRSFLSVLSSLSFLSWGCSGDLSDRDRRSLRTFNRWLLAWSFSVGAGIVLFAKDGLLVAPAIRWTVALLPDLLGVFTVLSYVRFLRHADELVRKVHLEAMALGFGAGLVFLFGYRLATEIGAPPLDGAEPAAIMLVFSGIGQWLGLRRYR